MKSKNYLIIGMLLFIVSIVFGNLEYVSPALFNINLSYIMYNCTKITGLICLLISLMCFYSMFGSKKNIKKLYK